MLKAKVIKRISDYSVNIGMMQQIAKKTGKPLLTVQQAMKNISDLTDTWTATWTEISQSQKHAVPTPIGYSIVKVFEVTIKL